MNNNHNCDDYFRINGHCRICGSVEPDSKISLAPATCSACGGDGIETCDNPDHGFISVMPGDIGRLGCPCCGHHPEHKMSGPCPECNGTGIMVIEPKHDAPTGYVKPD